jgi:predicted nucleic acid-binding protein
MAENRGFEVEGEVGRNGFFQGVEDCQEAGSSSVPREEKMKRIYLDSNVLIAHFSVDKAEEAKKKLVENALVVFAQLKDVSLCTSIWAITEMVNILVSHKKMARGEVAEIESQFVSERRLRDLKILFTEVSPQKDYDFMEFFYHVRQGILKYHSGVGDIIHSVIMKNNGITEILTFDEKDDFKQIPGLTVLHPKDIKI